MGTEKKSTRLLVRILQGRGKKDGKSRNERKENDSILGLEYSTHKNTSVVGHVPQFEESILIINYLQMKDQSFETVWGDGKRRKKYSLERGNQE